MKKMILIFLLFNLSFSYGYNLDFFSKFNDCYLEEYIQEALLNNHDLKQADERVKQYRFEISNALSKEFPSLSVSSSYLGTHVPNRDYNIFLQKNSYVLPFRVNYEPDFLLKNKDKIKSTKHLYKAQIANKNSTYISLLTDVASTYVNILLYDYLIKKQKEILKYKAQNLKFDYNKFKYGIIDSINLNNSEDEYYSQISLFNILEKNRNTALYNFSLLLGKSSDCINEIKRGKLENFEYQSEIPKVISSDVIYSRPDIIEIENLLKSSKIDITIAKKDFFPTFNVTGFLAFDTAGGGNFFSWNSSFAYILAGVTQDIFKGGAKLANLKIKKARFCELMERYLQTDLKALKEINNALNLIQQDKKTEKTSNLQLALEARNFEFSDRKFKRGVISKIDWLNDKNSYHQQEQITGYVKAQRLVDYFTLYKSTGGQL